MWRIGLSMIGSYTGRMQPPGNPKIVSTPSISSALIRAWPPFISWDFIRGFLFRLTTLALENKKASRFREAVAKRVRSRRSLRTYYYENSGAQHEAVTVTHAPSNGKYPFLARTRGAAPRLRAENRRCV